MSSLPLKSIAEFCLLTTVTSRNTYVVPSNYSFFIRTGLLATLLLVLGCGGSESDATEALVRKMVPQGQIKESRDRNSGKRYIVGLTLGHKQASQLLPHLAKLSTLRQLTLAGKKFTKVDFENLTKIRTLEKLTLTSNQLDDSNLRYLQPLQGLKQLKISHNPITDQGLPYLSTLTELRFLDLSFTKVRGHGFSKLQGLTKLRKINLSYTDLEDGAMQYFTAYKNLQVFYFNNTRITEKGLMELASLHVLIDIAPPDDIVGPDHSGAVNRNERSELIKERRRAKKALWARFWKARLESVEKAKSEEKLNLASERIGEIKERIKRYEE